MSDPAPALDTGPLGPSSRQRGRLEHGTIKRALQRGCPVRALRTAYRISVHTSGNPEGVKIRTRVLARHVGVSVRTVQRDLRALEGRLPGLKIERKRVTGERAKSHPSKFQLPQVEFSAPGVPLWAELTTRSEWTEATATHQGLLVYLCDAVGYSGRQCSFNQIAREACVSRSTARAACYYWRRVGWLEMEAQNTPEEGSLPNFLRVRVPWEAAPPTAHLPEPKRRERALAPVARWSGLEIASRDRAEGGWWARVGRSIEERDSDATSEITTMLARYLGGPARECGYKNSSRHRDIVAVLGTIWARRDGYDREIAEGLERASSEPLRRTDRRWGEPWYGDWRPDQAPQADLETWDASGWDSALAQASHALDEDDAARGMIGAYWRELVRPYRVVEGALVLLVDNPLLGDVLARAWVRELAQAVGGPIALRLASQHRHVQAGEAHGALKTLAPRLSSAGQRLDAIEQALASLPDIGEDRPRQPRPEAQARFERWLARGLVRDQVRDMRKDLSAIAKALAWTREDREMEPDWSKMLVSARVLIDERLGACAQNLARAQELGGMPPEFVRNAP